MRLHYKLLTVTAYLILLISLYIVYQMFTLQVGNIDIHQPTYNKQQQQAYNKQQADNTVTEINVRRNLNSQPRKSKVLCMIFTCPKNINRTLAVKNTWAKRCDKYLFFSNFSDPFIPIVALNVTESRQKLALKVRLVMEYVYKHYIDEFDWFLKVDDDAYIILENLYKLLNSYDPNEPVYIGKRFTKFNGTYLYMSGGAGYVVSKASVKILVTRCFDTYPAFFRHSIEDVAIGYCAQQFNFTVKDSRDSFGRDRFHGVHYSRYAMNTLPDWVHEYSVTKVKKGMESFSNETISFHYIEPWEMYLLEFFVYKLNVAAIT